MAKVCEICNKKNNSKAPGITCGDCMNWYHGGCLPTPMSRDDIATINDLQKTWKCPDCVIETRKSMLEQSVSEGVIPVSEIIAMFKELQTDMKRMEKNLGESIDLLYTKVEESVKSIEDLSKEVTACNEKIDKIENENKILKTQLSETMRRCDDLEQAALSNFIEIHGVPVQKREDPVVAVRQVAKAINFSLQENMIDTCRSIRPKNSEDSATKIIQVKFVRSQDKEEFMRLKRVKRNLSTRHLDLTTDQQIYINECLTPTRRQLLKEAKAFKKEEHYKYLWIREGKILLRKSDGSQVIVIKKSEDIQNL